MTSTPANLSGGARRTDLDWIRIAAFGLLILYHVGVFYAPGPTAVGAWSPRVLHWLVVPMLALNPWRLLLLFIVSGAATRFMADRMTAGALFKSRSSRLLIPLLFGVAVIVPPQVYVQLVERYGLHGDYLSFLGRYFTGDHSFCRDGSCVIMPTYNHLWFVAYLWNYTVILVAALAWAPKAVAWLQRGVERALEGPGLILTPALWLVAAKALIEPHFPLSGNPATDWYMHAIYLPGFLLGFTIVRSPAIWARIEALRWTILAGALTAYATIITLGVIFLGADLHWLDHIKAAGGAARSPATGILAAALWGFDQWFWILAVFGFGHRHLQGRDGPARRYLTEAVFPFYIIHQTTIEVVGHYLAPVRLPIGLEAAIIIGLTAASCVATYEIARRVPLLRPVFGLKSEPRRKAEPVARIVFADVC